MVLEELEERYEEFCQPLREQGIPLPSFTMLLALLALLILLIFIWLAKPFEPKTIDMEVLVLNGNSPVWRAKVQAFDSKMSALSEGFTGSDGRIILAAIPRKNILLRAGKAGVGEYEGEISETPAKKTVQLGSGANASVNKSVEILLAVSDESTQKPIGAAAISYTFQDEPGKKFKVVTDLQGKAKLSVPQKKAVSMVIEHAEYDTKALSVKAAEAGKVFQVKLRKKLPGASPNPSAIFAYGTLRVSAKDGSGKSINPLIELYDAATSSLLDSKIALDGKASFPNLLTGFSYYVKARLLGYLEYDGSLSPAQIGKKNEIEIVMRKDSSSVGPTGAKMTVITMDEEGSQVPARVAVVSGEAILLERSSQGRVEFDLAQLSSLPSLKFIASGEGRLLGITEEYLGSELPREITIVLPLATPENSAALKVITKDRKGALVQGAIVKIYSEALGFITAAASDGEGAVKFTLEKGVNYAIVSEYGGQKGVASAILTEDKELTIFLGGAVETIKLAGVNALSGEEVEATFEVIYGNETFDSCTGSHCSAFAKTLEETEIRAQAEGYFERSTLVKPSGEGKEIQIGLVPLEIKDAFVKYEGIYDQLGREAQEVEAGKAYSAKIIIAMPGADKIGAYFRAGSGVSAANDIAYISGFAAPAGGVAIKGKTYSPSSKCAEEGGTESKWMNVEFAGLQTAEVNFKFVMRASAQKEDDLPFYFMGFAAKEEKYFRVPQDDALGLSQRTAMIDWCHAKTSEGAIPIRKSSQYTCTSVGCLSLTLEQAGLEGSQNFQARSALNCKQDPLAANSCNSALLKVKAKFAPNDPSRDFDLEVGQEKGKVQFQSGVVNSQAANVLGGSRASAPLTGASEYFATFQTIPEGIGDERITVTVTESSGVDSVAKSASFQIFGGCANGLKDCGGGVCSQICIKDPFEGDEEEVIDPPTCEDGWSFCNDGVCRPSCEIPKGDLPKDVKINVRNGTIEVTDGETGKKLEKITMQIDQFVPVDEITINFSGGSSGCTPLYAVISENTAACYSIDNGHLVFRGGDLSADCGLRSIGDSGQGDKSAKLRIGCLSSNELVTDIPIEVSFKPIPLKSIQFQPASFSGSSAKIFHIINEKQVPKDYTLAGIHASFEYADAFTYAWGGGGTLELKDQGTVVADLEGEKADSYFPDIDSQGGRTNSCHDYVCCSGKWCTTTAASQAFLLFKDAAKKTADASAFRRGAGNNFLMEKVIGRPFTFSTVIRLLENAKLPSEIAPEDSPTKYGCKEGNPRIYVVQASSVDGKVWSYTARIARLYKLFYIDPPEDGCKDGALTPALPQTTTHAYSSAGKYIALCNFLRARKNCVESEADSSLASQEQVEKKRQMTPIPIPSSFWTAYVARASVCNIPGGQAHPHLDLPGVLPFPRWTSMVCITTVGAACIPKRSYVDTFTMENQMFAIVHIGISESCMPDFLGTGIVAGTFYGTYEYPEYSKYANAAAGLASSAIIGDFDTCAVLYAASQAVPDEKQLEGSAAICSMYSQMKANGYNFLRSVKAAGKTAASSAASEYVDDPADTSSGTPDGGADITNTYA